MITNILRFSRETLIATWIDSQIRDYGRVFNLVVDSELKKIRSDRQKINCLMKTAKELVVSPITIYKEVNKYAKENNLEKIDLEKVLYAATTNFTNEYYLVSEILCETNKPNVMQYIQTAEEKFSTIFFKLLNDSRSEM